MILRQRIHTRETVADQAVVHARRARRCQALNWSSLAASGLSQLRLAEQPTLLMSR